MRGDHEEPPRSPNVGPGTSPHARGPRVPAIGGTGVGGNIPACAGTTEPPRGLGIAGWEHPRMRGDHFRAR